MSIKNQIKKESLHEDPITGECGAHPVGTGVGAALAGAAAGMAVGTLAGPIGAAVGVAVGAVAGGFVGKAVAETIDPTVELEYWTANCQTKEYYDPNLPIREYESAHHFAVREFEPGCHLDDCEADLQAKWEASYPESLLNWETAKRVIQDTWDRLTSQTCASNGRSCK